MRRKRGFRRLKPRVQATVKDKRARLNGEERSAAVKRKIHPETRNHPQSKIVVTPEDHRRDSQRSSRVQKTTGNGGKGFGGDMPAFFNN